MRDFFFEGRIRLDWGFGNPNVTGALIAMLMVGVWLLSFLGRWGFWLVLIMNLSLGVFLIQTFSRGSLIALMGGLVPVIWVAQRPWKKARLMGILVVIAVLGAYAWHLRALHRYGKGIVEEDGSIANRLLIYRVVPRMIFDAPEGWGWGRSAEAYRQWYQPTGRLELYTHLVSSHATWLVEFAWPTRIGYILGWALCLCVCAPSKARGRWRSALLGIWFSFWLACCFSHVGIEKWLWGVPSAALLVAVVSRTATQDWPTKRNWLMIPGLTVGVLGLLLGWASLSPWQSKVSLKKGVVEVGEAREAVETIGILNPDRKVLGEFYGHRIREALDGRTGEARSYSIQWSETAVVESGLKVLVVAGEAATMVTPRQAESLVTAKEVLLINPSEPSQTMAEALPKIAIVQFVAGQMWGDSSKYIWDSLLSKHPAPTRDEIPMASTFIPRWTSLIVPSEPAVR